MHSCTRRQGLLVALNWALAVPVASASSPSWPNRPIKLVVPFPAGQGTDIFARLVADGLSRSLGQPVVVENKAGASGVIGNDAVAKAAPDGYTLLFSNASATVMFNALGLKTPYDLEADLVPVAQVGMGGVLLLARPDLPASDLKQLVRLIQRHPGKYQYATWGTGSGAHLMTEALKKQHGLKFEHVPYKAITQITQEMIGGVIDIGWTDTASVLPLVRSGALKPLAVSGAERVGSFPDLQTMTEQGFPVGSDGWYGVFAPKGVPAEMVERLNREVNLAMAQPAMRERMQALNMASPPIKTAQQFAATFQEDLKIWRDMALRNGLVASP